MGSSKKTEIFPEREQEYFAKTVDALITFDTDDQGRSATFLRALRITTA
jgi:hypothetical protein